MRPTTALSASGRWNLGPQEYVESATESVFVMRKTRQNKTMEEYRQLAEKCRESARTVSAENERIELLARAHTWDRIAECAEHAAL